MDYGCNYGIKKQLYDRDSTPSLKSKSLQKPKFHQHSLPVEDLFTDVVFSVFHHDHDHDHNVVFLCTMVG